MRADRAEPTTDVHEPAPRAVPGPAHPGRARRVAERLVLAVPVVWVVVVGWTHRWMTEDGFIYLRIVRQVRAGNGPVYNEGERVEAFTGVLWVALLSVGDLLTPIRLEWLSIVVGLAGTAGGVLLAIAGSRRLWSGYDDGAVHVPFGAVVFVAVFPLWAYATSGLETGLVFCWLGLCLWLLARWADDRSRDLPWTGAVVIGLGWLVRPEMVLFSAAFVLVVLALQWRSGGWPARVRLVAAAVALPLAYQVFRMGYFGSLVANTAIAKEGTGSNLDRGWRYFVDFARPYWMWLPALGLLAGGYGPLTARLARVRDVRRVAVVGAFVVCGLANTAYVIAVGGDYHHGRMFLPALFAVCAPVAVLPWTRRHLAGAVVGVWALVAVVTLRPEQHEGDNWFANGFLAPRDFGSVTLDEMGWGPGSGRLDWYSGPGYYYEAGILAHRRADVALRTDLRLPYGTFWAIGASGYAVGTDFHVLDGLGLADTLAAHLEGEPPLDPSMPRGPGHEKPLPSPWIAARVTPAGTRPDAAQFPSFPHPLIPPTTGQEFQEQVAWARAALGCDDIERLLVSAQEPLTPKRFLANLVRAPQNTFVRIPADPEEAYHRFCGPGTPPEVERVRAAAPG